MKLKTNIAINLWGKKHVIVLQAKGQANISMNKKIENCI